MRAGCADLNGYAEERSILAPLRPLPILSGYWWNGMNYRSTIVATQPTSQPASASRPAGRGRAVFSFVCYGLAVLLTGCVGSQRTASSLWDQVPGFQSPGSKSKSPKIASSDTDEDDSRSKSKSSKSSKSTKSGEQVAARDRKSGSEKSDRSSSTDKTAADRRSTESRKADREHQLASHRDEGRDESPKRKDELTTRRKVTDGDRVQGSPSGADQDATASPSERRTTANKKSTETGPERLVRDGRFDKSSTMTSDADGEDSKKQKLKNALSDDVRRGDRRQQQTAGNDEVRIRIEALMARARAKAEIGRWNDARHAAQLAQELCDTARLNLGPDEDRPQDLLQWIDEQAESHGALRHRDPSVRQAQRTDAGEKNTPEQALAREEAAVAAKGGANSGAENWDVDSRPSAAKDPASFLDDWDAESAPSTMTANKTSAPVVESGSTFGVFTGAPATDGTVPAPTADIPALSVGTGTPSAGAGAPAAPAQRTQVSGVELTPELAAIAAAHHLDPQELLKMAAAVKASMDDPAGNSASNGEPGSMFAKYDRQRGGFDAACQDPPAAGAADGQYAFNATPPGNLAANDGYDARPMASASINRSTDAAANVLPLIDGMDPIPEIRPIEVAVPEPRYEPFTAETPAVASTPAQGLPSWAVVMITIASCAATMVAFQSYQRLRANKQV